MTVQSIIVVLSGALAVTIAIGCTPERSSRGGGPGASSRSQTAANTGGGLGTPQELFKGRCAPCHGDNGRGDGPGAAALNPKPRNYTDTAWQASVKDDDIKKAILYGGAAVNKSPVMPANPDLDGKPELDGLVTLIRGFKKS